MLLRSRVSRRWRGAATLADLGALTAEWLEGRLPGGHPGGYDRPDEETLPLVAVLAAANRAGFVTEVSQPGFDGLGHDGRRWEQRAAVAGLVADEGLAARIVAAARRAGLVAELDGGRIPATRTARGTTAWFGGPVPDSYRRACWDGVGRDGICAATAARRLVVLDPVWGRGPLLWSVLAGAVSR